MNELLVFIEEELESLNPNRSEYEAGIVFGLNLMKGFVEKRMEASEKEVKSKRKTKKNPR